MTDYQGNTKRLADQVGFKYHWDARTEQWAHTAAIMVLTPDGRVSRYLYGVRFKDRDMRLALTEASEGKLGTFGDKMMLFCFHYDPEAKGVCAVCAQPDEGGRRVDGAGDGNRNTFLFRRERKSALPMEWLPQNELASQLVLARAGIDTCAVYRQPVYVHHRDELILLRVDCACIVIFVRKYRRRSDRTSSLRTSRITRRLRSSGASYR